MQYIQPLATTILSVSSLLQAFNGLEYMYMVKDIQLQWLGLYVWQRERTWQIKRSILMAQNVHGKENPAFNGSERIWQRETQHCRTHLYHPTRPKSLGEDQKSW